MQNQRESIGARVAELLALSALVLAASSCTSKAAEPTSAPGDAGSVDAGGGDAPGAVVTIKLAENSWLGSRINNLIVKQILTEKLGYNVESVVADEAAMWDEMTAGRLQGVLEVWPSGHDANYKKYVASKQLEDGGELGVLGKIGWYIPSYLLATNPELASWEGFKNPANAALFSTPETGAKGQFLAGVTTWSQYDTDIIKNLQLPFQVVFAGSEEKLLAEVDQAYDRRKPILFYFWVPHWALAKYDLTQVKLPNYNDACYAKAPAGGVDCDYPTDRLYKVFSPSLATTAPKAHAFLKAFTYSTKDQIAAMAAVELDKKTPEEAASAWVTANKAKWEEFLPK